MTLRSLLIDTAIFVGGLVVGGLTVLALRDMAIPFTVIGGIGAVWLGWRHRSAKQMPKSGVTQ
jgi:hypothetical protein